MANVEIDEVELMNMRQVTGAVQKILANPAARKKLLEAQKDINPNAVIPELDQAKPFQDALAKTNEELAALRKQRDEDKAEAVKEKNLAALTSQWEAGRSKARKSGYTDDGLQALEKFMEEKGVADFDVAMAAFEKLNPPQETVAPAGGRFDLIGRVNDNSDTMKRLLESHGQDNFAVGSLVNQALSDVRTGSR